MGKKFKVALALGGGGVRGLAHIGVFKAFERKHIPIDLIVGTSMGAIIGGAYALSGQSYSLEQKVLELLKREKVARLESLAGESRPEEKKMIIEGLVSFVKELLLWNLKGVKIGVADGQGIKAVIHDLTQGADFTQTKTAFACVACDLKTGEKIILDEGKMTEAIMASSCIPGVFAPIELEGRLLVDGYVISEVPVEAARKLGADFIVAVNVEQKIFHDKFRHGMDVLFQADEIRSHELVQIQLKLADFIIRPDVKDFSWAAFSKGLQCIQEGEKAAYQIIPKLKSVLVQKRSVHFLKRLFFIR